ncbi:response regulator transcription factor [Streptomyces sp. A0592]|uniref:response regulator n=1 Tax=Streptomyces sp. A0592 TaxID=2563099 RepID=UPI00109EDD2B|nr:response regulator transcription factor [Streptomyces sp. A0592]THA81712.1 response regulator transcription factor [Streptomyces sp. A0592]
MSDVPGAFVEAPIKVFLLDDHEVVRRGLRDLLDAEADITVVGEAGTADQALARGPARRPDVAVLDVRLPDGDGIAVCRELRSRMPELACLMLTSFDDEDALLDAIMAGAAGYVLKQIKGTDLVSAVRTVAGGQSMLDPATTARLMRSLRAPEAAEEPEDTRLAALSERERAVLELIDHGLTNRRIAKRLYLSEKTVKNHISRLLAKLGVERRVQAAVVAAQVHAQRRDGEAAPGHRPAGPEPTRT